MDFIRAVRLSRIHVFPYSRRKGTLADQMPGQVPEPVKHTRAKALIASHPEVISVFIADFVSEVKLDIPNLRIVKKPLSCMNLSMLYNREKVSFIGTIDHDGETDFTAPDAWVLIVDDNTVNLTVAEGLLEPLKLKTATATSGKEALRKVSERAFDIVLMDHMMPEMDGIEATQKIREEHPEYKDIPIIALTANAVGNAKELFMQAGMNDFIAKPIEVRVLVSKIKQWLPKDKIKRFSGEEKEPSQAQERSNPPLLDESLVDLDTAAAIKLVGSEQVFRKILKEYYRLIPSKSASIQAHFDQGDWEAYTIEVHALKSSSRQIGAAGLSEMAAELEKAGKAGDTAFIREHHAAAMEKYRAYEQILAPYCGEPAGGGGQEKKECDPAGLREAFGQVRRAALDLDMDLLEEACGTLSGYRYPADQQELLSRLLAACDELDMDRCADIVDEWDSLVV